MSRVKNPAVQSTIVILLFCTILVLQFFFLMMNCYIEDFSSIIFFKDLTSLREREHKWAEGQREREKQTPR